MGITTAAAIIGGGAVLSAGIGGASSVLTGNSARKAASAAESAQQLAADQGISEQRDRFAEIQELLNPYITAGENALAGQTALTGLDGPEAFQAQLEMIKAGPEYNALINAGEEAILQNAAATGGLRGGNLQRSLAEFRPNVLASLLNKQYDRFTGLRDTGQHAALQESSFGQQLGANISNLYTQKGLATAHGALAKSRATQQNIAGVTGATTDIIGVASKLAAQGFSGGA